MTDLKSITAPAISEAGFKRLVAFARPSRMSSASTLFDAGYEQCKADFLFKLNAELAIPAINEPPPGSYRLMTEQALAANVAAHKLQARSRFWPW